MAEELNRQQAAGLVVSGPVTCWWQRTSSSTRSGGISLNMVDRTQGAVACGDACRPTQKGDGPPASEAARAMFLLMLDLLAGLEGKIADLDKEIARQVSEMKLPSQADDRSVRQFDLCHRDRRPRAAGRDLCQGPRLRGLVAGLHASSKIYRWCCAFGVTSKMGERTLPGLPPPGVGRAAVVQQASKRGAPKGSWLEQMLARKPRMLVIVALANKMARIIWALLCKQENYRASGRSQGVRPGQA